MDDIKLSERVREEYYISGSEDFCVQQFVLADEIAALEQRIAELEETEAENAELRGRLDNLASAFERVAGDNNILSLRLEACQNGS